MRNPFTLFAYWHLSERKRSLIRLHFGEDWRNLGLSLRLYEITGLSFDGSVARDMRELPLGDADFCYLQDLRPGRVYVADLGVSPAGHMFLPLLRSNAVHTPGAEDRLEEMCSSARLLREPATTLLPLTYEQFSAYTLYPASPLRAGNNERERSDQP